MLFRSDVFVDEYDYLLEIFNSARFFCSNSTMEAPEQCVKSVQSWQWRHQNDIRRRSGVFIVNFEQISHIALVLPLSTFGHCLQNFSGESVVKL